MPNLKPNHTRELDSETLPEFLAQGWFLALDADRVLVGWGEQKTSSSTQLFAPDFFLKSEPNECSSARSSAWSSSESCEILERSRLASLVLSGLGGKVNTGQQFQWVEPSRQEFENQFASVREGMRERGLGKAVPIVFASAEGKITADRRLALLANALEQPTHLFPYGFWNADEGMIGVTPEILFSQNEE
ncbi:MAG: hypothetical protein EOP06_32610, partial [Proteobacteria bacterium]